MEIRGNNQNVQKQQAMAVARPEFVFVDNRNPLLAQGSGYRITAISNIHTSEKLRAELSNAIQA